MLKNGIVAAAALVALLGLGACGSEGGETEAVVEQGPAVVGDAEEVSAEAVRGTVVMDTVGAGAVVDTATVPADTSLQQ